MVLLTNSSRCLLMYSLTLIDGEESEVKYFLWKYEAEEEMSLFVLKQLDRVGAEAFKKLSVIWTQNTSSLSAVENIMLCWENVLNRPLTWKVVIEEIDG